MELYGDAVITDDPEKKKKLLQQALDEDRSSATPPAIPMPSQTVCRPTTPAQSANRTRSSPSSSARFRGREEQRRAQHEVQPDPRPADDAAALAAPPRRVRGDSPLAAAAADRRQRAKDGRDVRLRGDDRELRAARLRSRAARRREVRGALSDVDLVRWRATSWRARCASSATATRAAPRRKPAVAALPAGRQKACRAWRIWRDHHQDCAAQRELEACIAGGGDGEKKSDLYESLKDACERSGDFGCQRRSIEALKTVDPEKYERERGLLPLSAATTDGSDGEQRERQRREPFMRHRASAALPANPLLRYRRRLTPLPRRRRRAGRDGGGRSAPCALASACAYCFGLSWPCVAPPAAWRGSACIC